MRVFKLRRPVFVYYDSKSQYFYPGFRRLDSEFFKLRCFNVCITKEIP